jgi:phosphatidylglycerophosphate synthase
MPSERSLPDSAAECARRRSVGPSGGKIILPFLQVNRYLNRPLALLLVRAVFRTRITPNQLTYVSFFIGLAGAFAFSRGKPPFFALGAILAQLSSVVDCADGMLARARNRMSEYGAYLDLILDRVNEFFLIAGVVLGYYAWSGRVRILVLGLVALGLYFLQITVFYLTESFAGRGIRCRSAESRGLLLFLIFVFGVVNRIDLGIYVLFTVSLVMNLYFLYSFLRRARR